MVTGKNEVIYMITVKVKLYGHLKRYYPEAQKDPSQSFSINIPEGSTAKDLAQKLNLPDDETELVFINNHKETFERKLENGDEVVIFPLIAGG